MEKSCNILKLTVFCCHSFAALEDRAEPKAKHLALTGENGISSWARFFTSLRCAQNDKLLYVLVNKRITTIDAIESVSLSKINKIQVFDNRDLKAHPVRSRRLTSNGAHKLQGPHFAKDRKMGTRKDKTEISSLKH